MNNTIIWSVLSVAGASVTLATALAVPVVPNFTQGLNDEAHRDNTEDHRNNKQHGLFHWLSVLGNGFWRNR